jgi:hypothetical protein
VFVIGTEGRPTTVSMAIVTVSRFDNCTGTTLLAAFGRATLTDQASQVDTGLTSARLNATLQVTAFVAGSTAKLGVDLTWSGTGELVRQSERFPSVRPALFCRAA